MVFRRVAFEGEKVDGILPLPFWKGGDTKKGGERSSFSHTSTVRGKDREVVTSGRGSSLRRGGRFLSPPWKPVSQGRRVTTMAQ